MIDLTKKDLPNAVEVDGKSFLIHTDFRVWLRFARCLKEEAADVAFIFVDDLPPSGASLELALIEFYSNPNPCPHGDGDDSGVKLIDYDIDSEYIYAAFMQQYGIDLLTINMHWHIFKALFLGLSEQTKMSQIIAARASNEKDEYSKRCKAEWALPISHTSAEQDKIDEFNELF